MLFRSPLSIGNGGELFACIPTYEGKVMIPASVTSILDAFVGCSRITEIECGVVQQDVYLFSGTVFNNISYGKLDATREEVIQAGKLAGADEFISLLPDGYDTYVGERGVKLSGGQKQRISIARLFLKNPPILILDEATSALDNESEMVVQESLERLSKNRTTFTIAHRLTTIRNASKILVLTEKGIVESGTHDELIKLNGEYRKLYRLYER